MKRQTPMISALLLILMACDGTDVREDTGETESTADCQEVGCDGDGVCVESSESVWSCESDTDWDGDGFLHSRLE